MSARPARGSPEEAIYQRLLPAMSRAGRQVDVDACAELASVIQTQGHRSRPARTLARALGLDPAFLPRRRT